MGNDIERVDHLLRAQVDLEQLTLDQRTVSDASDTDVGIAVIDERAGPVVVAASRTVVAGVDLPKHRSGRRIERIPVRIAAADVDNAVLYGDGRGDAHLRWK